MNFLVMPTLLANDSPAVSSPDALSCSPLGAIGMNGVCGAPSRTQTAQPRPEQFDLLLRKRFISVLMDRAQHDFHQASETHLFYAYYSKASLVRSFHPLRDKAFEYYVLLANNLAATSEDSRIQQWLCFIEECGPDQNAARFSKSDFPCSGVVNFKVKAADDFLLETLSSQLSSSFGKMSAAVLSEALPILNENIRHMGIGVQGVEIRRFVDSMGDSRQRTVRVDKKIHANLVAKAHELSVAVGSLSSFLFHLYLTNIRAAESSVMRFR